MNNLKCWWHRGMLGFSLLTPRRLFHSALVVTLGFCFISCQGDENVPGDSQKVAPPKQPTVWPSEKLPDLEYKPTPEQESDADGRATEGAGKGSDEGIDELFRQGIITKEARDAYYDNKLRKSGWWPKEGGLRTGGGATGSLTGDPGRDLGSAFKKLAGDGNADPVKDLENLGKGLWEGLKKADAWMKGDDNP